MKISQLPQPHKMQQSTLDRFYFWYFIVHIPITVLIDSSLVIPSEYLPSISQKLLELHINTNKDFLIVLRPIWLQVFGAVELLFQLPLFVVGAYLLYKKSKSVFPYMLLYGFNASFTTTVCIAFILHDSPIYGFLRGQTAQLAAVYLPYFIIPFIIMVDYLRRISNILSPHTITVQIKKQQ